MDPRIEARDVRQYPRGINSSHAFTINDELDTERET